jgi:adenosine kinase
VQKSYTHLIVTGSLSIDRIMNFSGHYKDLIQADKLHVLSLSVLIDGLTNSRGGTAGNIAYNLALMGQSPVILGSIGPDATDYLSDLAKIGVDTSHVHVSHLPTPTFTVMTDSDDNQIGGFYPGAMSDIGSLTLAPWYNTNSLIIISANDPTGMDQLVNECITHGLDYVYDVGQQTTNITIDQLKLGIENTKMLFVNDYELGLIISRTGYSQEQISRMIPVVVTTLGAKGTRITGSTVKKALTIPAVKNIKVVDPTGAGDAYRGGFLYGYLNHYNLTTCASLGSITATYTISLRGTQTHTFALQDIKKQLLKHYGVTI